MPSDSKHKPGIGQTVAVVAVAAVALIVSLLVVPPFARAAGLFEKHIDYATAAAAFIIVVIATRRLKSLKK
jgi:hypothetical protein